MLSTEFEYLCTELECFLQGWSAFHSVGIALYRAEMLYRGMECFLDGWNAFDRVGRPLYMVEMLSRGLECFPEGGNVIYRFLMLSGGLQCSRQSL
jgi:hypothetical protein